MKIFFKILALILLFFNTISLTPIGSGAYPLFIVINIILFYYGWRVKPKEEDPIIEMHVSSSRPNIKYKTTYYPDSGKFSCNCPEEFRAFDGRCKHVKELEKKHKM